MSLRPRWHLMRDPPTELVSPHGHVSVMSPNPPAPPTHQCPWPPPQTQDAVLALRPWLLHQRFLASPPGTWCPSIQASATRCSRTTRTVSQPRSGVNISGDGNVTASPVWCGFQWDGHHYRKEPQ